MMKQHDKSVNSLSPWRQTTYLLLQKSNLVSTLVRNEKNNKASGPQLDIGRERKYVVLENED